MNDTAAGNAAAAASTSSTLDTASVLTTIHLAWIAVFAALVIVCILYGARAKHRRDRAERRTAEHAAEAGVETKLDRADGDPAAAAPPAVAPAAPPAGDEAANGPVTELKGLGPKVAARLGELGVTTVGQIAALDDDAARRLDDQLGPFRGRLERDRWIEQARFLAAGDRAGFEAVFGKL